MNDFEILRISTCWSRTRADPGATFCIIAPSTFDVGSTSNWRYDLDLGCHELDFPAMVPLGKERGIDPTQRREFGKE